VLVPNKRAILPVMAHDSESAEDLMFLFGLLLFGFGAAIGSFAIYDAASFRGSGEWAVLLPLLTLFLDGPFALVLFGMAFTKARGRHRTILLVFAVVLLAMPAAAYAARRAADAAYGRPLQRTLPFSLPPPAGPVAPQTVPASPSSKP
jgi:hypothetical protein